MFIPWPLLHDPVFQLAASLPVYFVGFSFFGRSAWHSVKNGVPNMDVLIFTGSFSAFVYSVAGWMMNRGTHAVHDYLFFETGTTIITLVLLGNLLEKNSVKKTTTEMNELNHLTQVRARRLHMHEGREHTEEVGYDEIRVNDVLLVNSGDQVPIDAEVISGEGTVNEAMITGESRPVHKRAGDRVTGGTMLTDGNLRTKAVADSRTSVLAGIIDMVKTAQADKPQVQKLADRISAVFVPAVLLIALAAFFINRFGLGHDTGESLMRAVAVLVISCPCAMGLATPTAVMVGIGKAARNGVLIRLASVLEHFAKIDAIVFDKTGTLTSGNFTLRIVFKEHMSEAEILNTVYNLELHSSHPIARSVRERKEWQTSTITFAQVQEHKGRGLTATDDKGNRYELASTVSQNGVQLLSGDIFLMVNDKLVATFTLDDEMKSGVKETIDYFHRKGISTVLLSGDNAGKTKAMQEATGIAEAMGNQMPGEKMQKIGELTSSRKVAMVGDGINDAPALSKASVGVSFSNASDIARQSSQVVLVQDDFRTLQRAHAISVQTYRTIRQNLFWAFFYNVVAIPLAAAGFLSPMLAALSMAFSDVIVIGNSLRLRFTKV